MPSVLYSSAFKPASEAMFNPSLVSGRIHWELSPIEWVDSTWMINPLSFKANKATDWWQVVVTAKDSYTEEQQVR